MNAYFKRVGSHANEIFGTLPNLKGVIIGGPGPTKYDFSEGDYLNYVLKQKIIGTIDTSYVGDRGVDEIVEKSTDILRGVRYMEEKKIVQKFLYEIGHETGLGIYGETAVRRALKDGVVNTLLLSERLGVNHVTYKCKNCGYEGDSLVPHYNLTKFEADLASTPCKQCSNNTLAITDSQDLVEEFVDLAEKSGANAEVITTETEEGVMLKESFGGVAAILRYRAS
jgi:peptide chain release factor subunit 1